MRFRVIQLPAALVGLALLLASGCIFSPERKPPKVPKPFVYLPPISPQNVLQNLVSSYTNRDSVETALVYDAAYQGSSSDPSQPTPVYAFTRADEVHHVHRLKNDPNIVSVQLDLGQGSTWNVLPGLVTDPPGALVIPIQFYSIVVRDVSSSEYVFKPVTMEYAFKPTQVAPGDTVWTVCRWTETAN